MPTSDKPKLASHQSGTEAALKKAAEAIERERDPATKKAIANMALFKKSGG